MNFQIQGSKSNPFHLSVGAVVIDQDKIALIKKPQGFYTLGAVQK